MYNFLTLLDDYQVTLNILKSLSTCCVVFNQNGYLIEINKPATDLLKIKNVEEYSNQKLKLELNHKFYRIVEKLKNGKTVCDKKFELKCADNSKVIVNLKASLFCNFNDRFIFQFSEIKPKAFIENSHILSDSINCDILMINLRLKELGKVCLING